MKAFAAGDLSLNAVLAKLGMAHKRNPDAVIPSHQIVFRTKTGEEICRGTAGDVWNYLRETGRIL